MASCHIMFQRSSIDKLRRSSSCPSSDSVERRTIWRLAKLINPFYHFRAKFAGASSLATRSEICHTSPDLAKPQAEIWPVFVRLLHSIGRAGCLAVVLGPLAGLRDVGRQEMESGPVSRRAGFRHRPATLVPRADREEPVLNQQYEWKSVMPPASRNLHPVSYAA